MYFRCSNCHESNLYTHHLYLQTNELSERISHDRVLEENYFGKEGCSLWKRAETLSTKLIH
jgi:hypothetical protein